MRVNNNQAPNPKPASRNNSSSDSNNTDSNRSVGPFHASTPNLCHEPTSVLDLRGSPSLAPAGKPTPSNDRDPLEWVDDHVLQTLDWESIMKELDFHLDDSAPSLMKTSFPQLYESQIQNQNLPDLTGAHPLLLDHSHFQTMSNWSVGFDCIQELIRAADCLDSNELPLAHAILEWLNQRMQSPIGKPIQRAAFFFKEALQCLLSGSTRPHTRVTSWPEVLHTIKASKAFSGTSPIPMFTHFTINQALLESMESSPPFIHHLIDFDIGLGCHYPSLMRELMDKAETLFLRITAVVTEVCAIETKLIKESLSQFANELNIRFQIDFVLLRTFEMLSFKAVKFLVGEKTAVLLSPAVFGRLSSANNLALFVSDLRRVSPNVVVCVDSEGWEEPGASFRRNFVNGLEFYSLMLESLDAAGGEWARKIETSLIKPRIFSAVEGCRRRAAAPWREVFYRAGMRPVHLSQFADFQAECLLGKVQVSGFNAAKRQSELVLCWHERPLVATSAWKFSSLG